LRLHRNYPISSHHAEAAVIRIHWIPLVVVELDTAELLMARSQNARA